MITPVLRVHDIDASLAFYTRTLGFVGEGGLPGIDGRTAYAEAYFGEARVMFSRRSERAFTGGVELYVQVPDEVDIDIFYAILKAQRVCIVADMHHELWGDCAFTVLDLDDNRLTFAQPIRYPARASAYKQIA